jgi:predicted signal transduction protein with EAL and GGDEF domain
MTSDLAPTQVAGRPWSLRAPLFAAAFPFHLVIDRDLRIRQAGPSLHRLCPGLVGNARLDSLFTVTTPRSASTFAAMVSRSRAIFLLRSVADHNVTLRGQMLYDERDQLLFFVGSPWVTDTAALARLGLTLDDFAVSDAVVDYVLLLQNQAASLATARELADRLQESAEELTHQAYHDSLTGLPNRNMFADRVRAAVAPEHGPACEHFAVLMLDLDGFKAVNDSYGHSTGDELLRIVAERLRHMTRPGDMVARLGGDEFAILVEPGNDGRAELHGTELHGAEQHGAEQHGAEQHGEHGRLSAADVADRAMATLREPVSLPPPAEVTIQIAASVGIAACGGAATADDVLRNADLAMYVAKSAGKDRHQRFKPAMHSAALARLELATALRAAVAGEELLLHYQPIVDTHTGQIAGVEALLRWPHPQRGFVPPDEFIPVAESIGVIGDLGCWVLRTACAQVRRWNDLRLAVNVSPLQLGPALPAQVRAALADADLSADRLTLEITETLLTGDDPQVLACLRELADDGVQLSVDDFGTGHSSLSRLHSFPIHELKIDKSFVIGLATGKSHAGLVAGVIALAHGINLEVVAEGVESADEYTLLKNLGCERAQGYHLGRPVPPEDIEALLKQHPTRRTC